MYLSNNFPGAAAAGTRTPPSSAALGHSQPPPVCVNKVLLAHGPSFVHVACRCFRMGAAACIPEWCAHRARKACDLALGRETMPTPARERGHLCAAAACLCIFLGREKKRFGINHRRNSGLVLLVDIGY